MPPPGGVSVALPIFRADPGALRDAYACIRNQTWRETEILLVLNGADAGLTRATYELARDEPRARVIELPRPGLSGALNAALKGARFELVARMDADDLCGATRLEEQAAYMSANPGVVALGTAWDALDEVGNFVGVERPPTEPRRVRWRLLLGNLFCHGSMMLRRTEVLAAGGYDESLAFAQDYELWLRLVRAGRQMANLPRVLYRYSAAMRRRHHEQAGAASAAMVRAWGELPGAGTEQRAWIAGLVAMGTWGGARGREAMARLEENLDLEGPTREALLAWQWIERRAYGQDQEKRARVRPVGQRLRGAGVESVWLYGAGRHTAWLVDNADELGVPIAGVADDELAGAERYGFCIASPEEVPDGAHVVLSSDAHEDALWDASLALRARGARVYRIYGAEGEAAAASP